MSSCEEGLSSSVECRRTLAKRRKPLSTSVDAALVPGVHRKGKAREEERRKSVEDQKDGASKILQMYNTS